MKLTRQQYIDMIFCNKCSAVIGENCKKADGSVRKSVHIERMNSLKKILEFRDKAYDPDRYLCQGCGNERELGSNHKSCVVGYVECIECKALIGEPCKGQWDENTKTYKFRESSHKIRWDSALSKRKESRLQDS